MKSRLTLLLLLCLGANAQAQAPGPGGRGPAPTPDPVVTPIPSIAPITGAGEVYDSAAAEWEGYGLEEFDYVVEEYRIAGTAAGEACESRMVIRRPRDDSRDSGIVIAEAMHPAGAAHA